MIPSLLWCPVTGRGTGRRSEPSAPPADGLGWSTGPHTGPILGYEIRVGYNYIRV